MKQQSPGVCRYSQVRVVLVVVLHFQKRKSSCINEFHNKCALVTGTKTSRKKKARFLSALIVHVTTPKMCLYLKDYGLMELPHKRNKETNKKSKRKQRTLIPCSPEKSYAGNVSLLFVLFQELKQQDDLSRCDLLILEFLKFRNTSQHNGFS